MCRTQLWLLAFLVFSTVLADGSPLKVMSVPNVLRVGIPENIFMECQDCSDSHDFTVEIRVLNHPTKSKVLSFTTVTLTRAGHFQNFGQITIPADDFRKDPKDPNVKQHVYLQAQFPNQLLEKVVLVSLMSGYIFIQTDKPIYTPSSKVLYRIVAVTPHMEPVEQNNQFQTDAHIAIEIVTPEGIILPVDHVTLNSGMYFGQYQLPEFTSPGEWKLVSKFQSNPEQSYSAQFEVKDYVLPAFEVKLTPMSSLFYVDSQELTVNIRATYLFGKEVDGMAYAVFGVMQQGNKRSFPASIQKVQINRGDGEAKLKIEHITQTFQNIHSLVGSSIFVAVSVLTESGDEMVEAQLRDIQIVTSPYTINFKKTPRYYKPRAPFDIALEVLYPDGSPAQGVAVVVVPSLEQGRTDASGIAKVSINTEGNTKRLTITAKTSDPALSPERQSLATMVALPHTTKSNSNIHIAVEAAEAEVGQNLRIYCFFSRQENVQRDITYLILSRGQLIKYGRYQMNNQVMISLMVLITKDMLPSFRIIVYYHTDDNEVVSDSVWVHVNYACMGMLKLEPTRPDSSYKPRKRFQLKLTGDPEATVGVVAVHKGVYALNNKFQLTQKKVWDILETFDTGCTPGGGEDSMSVFYDAGLLFESSASGTPHRQDLKCPGLNRRKRASAMTGDRTGLGGEDDGIYVEISDIIFSTLLPESWMWFSIKLPSCPGINPNCGTTSAVKTVSLPDSITTWQITGISLSRTHGICVANPLEVIVQKEFYIDLKLPYSAVRGEQLEIKAILYNYSPGPITVRVDLLESNNVCSKAYKRRKYHQIITVEPQTTGSVPFSIIPMKDGYHEIAVTAAVNNSMLNDGIRKGLLVKPEGVLVKSIKITKLVPAKKGVDGQQQEIINSGIPRENFFPNTPEITQISVTGEPISLFVEKPISGNSMATLIRQPSGSGEAPLFHMSMTVIATMYLDTTNQWDAVGFEKRNEALQYIKTGYQNQLVYHRNYGSFATFASYSASTWLTAYIAKVFTMASNLMSMQTSYICDVIKFMISNTQQPDGMFREAVNVFNTHVMSYVQGTDSDASMTAFCLIAMQESRTTCADTINVLPASINKAVAYLETRLSGLTNPYAVAMTSYALANENKLNRGLISKFFSPDLSHWPVPQGHVYTLEATAYILLALVKTQGFEEARPVVRWLSQQQKVDGGYGSPQATLMVYQAVAEYWASAKELEYNLDVTIYLPGRLRPYKYNFNRENYYITRTVQFGSINSDVTVIAAGTGEATLKMVSMYYSLPTEKETACQKFNLTVQLLPEETGKDEKTYKLRINVLYMNKEHDATMTILDIGLLTGFTANTNDLDLLSNGRSRIIAKYDLNPVVSERGSLIIYLDKVSHTRPEEITFRIHQMLNAAVLQPAAVSVFEYYDSETPCVKFYLPERRNEQLQRLCINDECKCAEESCSMQKKDSISNDQRRAAACDSSSNSRIDFVYKVRVEEFTQSLSTDIYTMRVLTVIKEGSFDFGSSNKLRKFYSLALCRKSLALGRGKTYLIMGSSSDVHSVDQAQYQYVLGEKTWIEYWPTEAECQTGEHIRTCLGLTELEEMVTIFGCPMK